MAWFRIPIPFFEESKNDKNLTFKRNKFTKIKAKEIRASIQYSVPYISSQDMTLQKGHGPVLLYPSAQDPQKNQMEIPFLTVYYSQLPSKQVKKGEEEESS